MPNTIITPAVIAREVLDRLYERTLMAQLVHRDFDADFAGQQGDTITVRRPAQFTAQTFDRAAGIQLQDITEASFTVALDTLLDVSFAVTAEELTLKIDDFSRRFLTPAAEAIARKIDASLLALAVSGAVTQTVGVNGTPSTDPKLLVDAAKLLNDQNVPGADRAAVLTTTVAANYLKTDYFMHADKSGSTEGLREGTIGKRVLGFDAYQSTALPVGGDGVAFHRTAFSVVSRTLAAPMGTPPTQVSVVNLDGFGLRVVQGYDQTKKQDVVSIDCLVGFKVLDPARAVKILG